MPSCPRRPQEVPMKWRRNQKLSYEYMNVQMSPASIQNQRGLPKRGPMMLTKSLLKNVSSDLESWEVLLAGFCACKKTFFNGVMQISRDPQKGAP